MNTVLRRSPRLSLILYAMIIASCIGCNQGKKTDLPNEISAPQSGSVNSSEEISLNSQGNAPDGEKELSIDSPPENLPLDINLNGTDNLNGQDGVDNLNSSDGLNDLDKSGSSDNQDNSDIAGGLSNSADLGISDTSGGLGRSGGTDGSGSTDGLGGLSTQDSPENSAGSLDHNSTSSSMDHSLKNPVSTSLTADAASAGKTQNPPSSGTTIRNSSNTDATLPTANTLTPLDGINTDTSSSSTQGIPAKPQIIAPAADPHTYTPQLNSVYSIPGMTPYTDEYDDSKNDSGFITLIEDLEVPAQEAGVLVEMNVKEGDAVTEGTLMAKIDEDQVVMAVRVADAKLATAKKQASNDVNIRYSQAACKVAWAEILQADEANKHTPGTIPQAEYRRLLLAHKQTELQIEQAQHEFDVSKDTVEIQQAERDASLLAVARRKITAPLSGIVVEKFRNKGEWVKPGDAIFRLIRLDTVRVKFTVDAQVTSSSDVKNRPVHVTVPLLKGRVFHGKVTFVNPMIESGGRYQVWAEIQNQKEQDTWLLQPGMPATAIIK